MIPPRRIILSGGGVKVISIIGALNTMYSAGFLKKVKEVCGVSAGAFLAFLVASGFIIPQIEALIIDLEFSVIRNMTPEAFLGFPETFGIDDGANFVKLLESIFRVALKIDPQITFEQFEKLGREGQLSFRCWATDLNTQSVREFSFIKTPSVKIIDALRASMCLPLYFTPIPDPINGHLLSDGGIQGSLPLHHLTHDECQESIAIGFSNPDETLTAVIEDLYGFINSLFTSLIHSRNAEFLKKWEHKILRIPIDNYPSWNFEISREDRLILLKKGALAGHNWIKNAKSMSRHILRRCSI